MKNIANIEIELSWKKILRNLVKAQKKPIRMPWSLYYHLLP